MLLLLQWLVRSAEETIFLQLDFTMQSAALSDYMVGWYFFSVPVMSQLGRILLLIKLSKSRSNVCQCGRFFSNAF